MAEQCRKVVRREELGHYTPAFVAAVKRAFKEQKVVTYWEWIIEPHPEGAKVFLRGAKDCWELFPKEVLL